MSETLCFKINGALLYLEQILVELDFPIMYTCLDENKNRYVILCIDYDELKYMIVKSNNELLLKMLNKTISMREIFTQGDYVTIITSGNDIENDKIEAVPICDLSNNDLPLEKALFEIDNQEINEFKQKLINTNTEISYCINESFINQKPICKFNVKQMYSKKITKPIYSTLLNDKDIIKLFELSNVIQIKNYFKDNQDYVRSNEMLQERLVCYNG